MSLINDAPIGGPADDLYSLDPFARAVATSIRGMKAPEGLVIAVNGPWGSGKSSAINLIKHHLEDAFDRQEIVPIPFNPWWFAGADALTLAFFHELSVAIGQSLPERIRKSLARIGGGVSAAGSLLGAAADLKAPGAGGLVSGAASWIGQISGAKRTVEQEHAIVAKALADQSRTFLVIIDDIDRLSPDDALTMFRLVKSVGRLPNVIYLLAFDRALAERAVAERFPSEGPSYLEKIVQSAFDIPPPLVDVLRHRVLLTAEAVMGSPAERDVTRFMNVFFDVVAPLLGTPRDVVRLENELKATWPAIAGEVDRADFLALSAIKLAKPDLYRAIRSHPDELCDGDAGYGGRDAGLPERYDRMFELRTDDPGYHRNRRALMRLFPRLEGIWSNVFHGSADRHEAARLLCSRKHFPTYFAYATGEDVIPAALMAELIQRADEREFVTHFFLDRLKHIRRNGTTQASLALEEVTTRSRDMDTDKVAPFVAALFSVADQLDVEADRSRGFSIGSNELRIHWLINNLINERFEEAERERIYQAAMAEASLGWLCDFARRCVQAYERSEDGQQHRDPLVSEEMAKSFQQLALDRLRDAARDMSLIQSGQLAHLLFQWRGWASTEEVRQWTDAALERDDFVIRMAEEAISVAWTQGMGFGGMGDRVARPVTKVNLKAYEGLLDTARLETRVAEVRSRPGLDSGQKQKLDVFAEAPRGSHSRLGDDDE